MFSRGALARDKDARARAAEVLRINPTFSVEYVKTLTYKNPADAERFVAALRKAGLK